MWVCEYELYDGAHKLLTSERGSGDIVRMLDSGKFEGKQIVGDMKLCFIESVRTSRLEFLRGEYSVIRWFVVCPD